MTAISNGGAAQRVKVLTAADLRANGGSYALEQRPPVAVYGVTDAETTAQGGDYVVMGNVAQPVYVVSAPTGAVEATIAPIPMIGVTGGLAMGNVAIPVYVVGGSLGGFPAPANLALSITGAGFDVITATWDAVAGATDYEIEYSDDGVTYTPVDTTALLTYGVTSADYDADTVTHYVRVRATGGAWASASMSWRELYLQEYFPLSEASGNRYSFVTRNIAIDNGTVGSTTGKVTPLSANIVRVNEEWFELAVPVGLSFAGDFTVAGWVMPDDTDFSVFLDRLDVGGSTAGYALGYGTDKFQWWAGDSHGNAYNGVTFSTGTWYHVLLEYTASTKTGGASVNNNTIETDVSTVDAVHAGTLWLGRFVSGFKMDGRLNGWGWWGRKLSAAQKADLYNGGTGRDVVPDSTMNVIVVEGDSLSAGYDLPVGDDYATQMLPLLGKGYRRINVSSPGDSIAAMLTAIAGVLGLYDAARLSNILCLWGGTNDIAFGSGAEPTLETNYQDYCEQAQAQGYQVVAFTLLPRSDGGINVDFETDRQTFNTWLRANYATFADALADVAANTDIGENGDSDNLTYYLADKVHMTAAGYAIVAGIVATAIEGL